MDKQYLQEKLDRMRSQYVGSTTGEGLATHMQQAISHKKMQKIKKKLVSLEMERCHKQMEHQDCSKIEEKILAQKSLFEKICKRG